MNHKDKIHLARKMNNGLSKRPFLSEQWKKRKGAIQNRVAHTIERQKEVALRRKNERR